MFEFEPTTVAQWFQQHGIALGLGVLLGSIGTAAIVARKLIQLRREVVL